MNMLDIMTKDVITVHQNDSLATANSIMIKAATHHLVVLAPSGKVVGILSDRDCKVAMMSPFAKGDPIKFAEDVHVKSIMTPAPYCISPHVSVGEAAQMMLNLKINALPVVHDDTLMGIVTSTDLLRILAGQVV